MAHILMLHKYNSWDYKYQLQMIKKKKVGCETYVKNQNKKHSKEKDIRSTTKKENYH